MRIGTLSIANDRPALMGIVNVTPDSFSDGGRFLEPTRAVAHALSLIDEGAEMIDIGGESSRPGTLPISADEELARILPVIEGIRRDSRVPISIDTTKSIVAKAAIECGADMINDISAGRFDPEMFSVAAKNDVAVCLMHMRGTPEDMQSNLFYHDLMGEIRAFLADAITNAMNVGVPRERIVIDPGIGFGKSAEDNVVIIRRLETLTTLGVPILVGPSRKSFIGKLLDHPLEKRLEATLASLLFLTKNSASILRVHDVGAARRFLDAVDLLQEKV